MDVLLTGLWLDELDATGSGTPMPGSPEVGASLGGGSLVLRPLRLQSRRRAPARG